jgi:hypothetical protein
MNNPRTPHKAQLQIISKKYRYIQSINYKSSKQLAEENKELAIINQILPSYSSRIYGE